MHYTYKSFLDFLTFPILVKPELQNFLKPYKNLGKTFVTMRKKGTFADPYLEKGKS